MAFQRGDGIGYDPDKTCGDYGGKTRNGKPCGQPAGWKSDDQTGRCHQHDSIAEAFKATKKSEILELLPINGNLGQLCKAVGITGRTLWNWKLEDPEFRENVDSIILARDRERASDVEDKVYERIIAGTASPAETIFFLKNRDPDRWKDIYNPRGPDKGNGHGMAPVDSAKAKLSKTLRDMASRAAKATRAVEAENTSQAQSASELADKVRDKLKESAPDEDDD